MDIANHDNLRPSKVSDKTAVGSNKNLEFRTGEKVESGFCKKCGAWYGQLGLEPTLELYLEHMLQITAELKRVLKPTGVMFWNHGDSYNSHSTGKGNVGGIEGKRKNKQDNLTRGKIKIDLPDKCMVMQNYRLILRMVDEQGWILRNTIVWHKPNHKPSSAKDRFTNAYEPVFMFVKNNNPLYWYNIKTGVMTGKKPLGVRGEEGVDWDWELVGSDYSESNTKIPQEEAEKLNSPRARVYRGKKYKKVSNWKSLSYWFDLDAVRVPRKDYNKNVAEIKRDLIKETDKSFSRFYTKNENRMPNPAGKNLGDVWTIPTQPFPEAHFATFPEKLVEPMIKAACPQWVCKKCGKIRTRITKARYGNLDKKPKKTDKLAKIQDISPSTLRTEIERYTIGWTDCGCNAGWQPGVVLDPFMGSGTTALVALKNARNFVGIEANPEYIKIAMDRIKPLLGIKRLDKFMEE